tara:strand:- start:9090 stop:10142 length:1053 start_codon:yes stop_codon:yes gene_type:complete
MLKLFSKKPIKVFAIILLFFLMSCSDQKEKMRIILDTDANNELDDQHAIAYLLANDNYFNVEGITVNTTTDGREQTDIDLHYDEALRIVRLMKKEQNISIYKGATQSFFEIRDDIKSPDFDGHEAVDYIITRAKISETKLVLLPIGKLTNIALALLKEPLIIPNIRIVWLGSNYPNPGEYNQDNDPSALQYILETRADFEMVMVRYGESSGTDAVQVSIDEIEKSMPGKGPTLAEPITGRHGGTFHSFGDYSVNLFQNYKEMYKEEGSPPSRPLFDMAAVAILKNSSWADSVTITKPRLVTSPKKDRLSEESIIWNNGIWEEGQATDNTITIWENFDTKGIIKDFFDSFN